jgi:hypothetical protein
MTSEQQHSICRQWGDLLRNENSPIAGQIRQQLQYFADHERDIRKTFALGFD